MQSHNIDNQSKRKVEDVHLWLLTLSVHFCIENVLNLTHTLGSRIFMLFHSMHQSNRILQYHTTKRRSDIILLINYGKVHYKLLSTKLYKASIRRECYHAAGAEGSGEVAGLVDHAQEQVGSWHRRDLVPRAVLTVNQVRQHTVQARVELCITIHRCCLYIRDRK